MPRAPKTERTWVETTLFVALWTIVAISLAGAAGAAYGAVLFGRIDRVDVPLDDPEETAAEGPFFIEPPTSGPPGVFTDDTLPPLGPPGPAINILIVGTDDSEGIPEDDPILTRRDESNLADVLMLLRVDSERGLVSLLSVPRDLWVPIDGANRSLKINSAFAFEKDTEEQRNTRLLNTFRSALDVPVNHMVVLNWAGFRGLVDLVGGVEVCFPLPTRDIKTGLNIEAPGVNDLGGVDALAYVRSRSFSEQNPDGTWSNGDGTGDLGRIARQQEFFRLLVDQTTDVRDPTKLHSIAFTALDNVTIDQALSIDAMLDLARRFSALEGDELRTATLDVGDIVRESRGVEYFALDLLDTEANEFTLDIFRGIEPNFATAKRVDVNLFGADLDQAALLSEVGFPVTNSGEVETERTELAYGPDGRAAAYLLASYIEGDVLYILDSSLIGFDVELRLAPGSKLLVDPVGKDLYPPKHPVIPTTTVPVSATTSAELTTTTEAPVCS